MEDSGPKIRSLQRKKRKFHGNRFKSIEKQVAEVGAVGEAVEEETESERRPCDINPSTSSTPTKMSASARKLGVSSISQQKEASSSSDESDYEFSKSAFKVAICLHR